MNWVGGVRRRVLQRDEVRRRQDLFFAAHALPAQQSASRNIKQVPVEGSQGSGNTYPTGRLSSGSLVNRTRISPRKWRNDELVCERIKKGREWNNFSNFLEKKRNGSQVSHASDLQLGRKGHTKAAKKASKTSLPPVRPASIHGPFSRYLLKLELQSVGLKLDEGQGSSKKPEPESRSSRETKERDSRDGRLARKSTASDKNREEDNEQPINQDETAKDNPELQDTRTRKKHTSSKDIALEVSHKTSKSKVPKHCDEGPGDKEVRRSSNLNNTPKERNKYLSRKTPERTHSCKTHEIMGHTSANVHDSQANAQTKSKNIKDSSSENTVHTEHHCNNINAKAYIADSKEDMDANKSLKNSDWMQQEQKSNKRDSDKKSSSKERRHSKRTHRASSLLDGAPRLRQVLSLTPDRYKGRIWAPLYLTTESSSQGKQNMDMNVNQVSTDKEQKTQKNTDSREKYKTLHKPSTSKVQREWEKARLTMLLGTQFKSSSNNDKDKQKDENNEERDNIAKLRSDYQSTQKSLNPPSPLDKADNAGKSHTSLDSSDTQQARGEIPDIKISDTPKRYDHNSQRPKLSTYTRTIYKIESGLSFARERKDKTPYLNSSFATPWLGGPIFDTSGSSFSSSRTPTDPTLERSCEDPLGSQGTELHLNTTVQSIITTQYQEEGEETDEAQTTIKKSGINQSQKHLFDRQYTSKEEACSPLPILYGYKNVGHNEGTWMINDRYADLVTDPHQFVTHQVSDENESLDSLYFDPQNSHWLKAHENKALPTQHQFACQYEGSTEGTSDMTNPSATHTQVPFSNVSYKQYGTNSTQGQVMTENGNLLESNEMLNYLDHSSGMVSSQAVPHPVIVPTSCFMADCNTHQELSGSMSQAPLVDKPLPYNHNSQFYQYSEAPKSNSPSKKWQHGIEKSENSFMHYKEYSGFDDMRRQAVIDAREQQHLRHDIMGSFHGENLAYSREAQTASYHSGDTLF